MTIAARAMAAAKLVASLSWRAAMRRQSFSRQNMRSIPPGHQDYRPGGAGRAGRKVTGPASSGVRQCCADWHIYMLYALRQAAIVILCGSRGVSRGEKASLDWGLYGS